MLNLPHRDHEHFPKTPLRAMLGQVRFDPILRVGTDEFLAEFQDALRRLYPVFALHQELNVVVDAAGQTQSRVDRAGRFSTQDGAWSVALSPVFLTLEADAPQYSGYPEFRERLSDVWELTSRMVDPARRTQVGLRYINHIERDVPATEWRDAINAELLGPVVSDAIGNEVVGAISELQLARPGERRLSIKHGIVAAGPQNENGYLLDFDYVDPTPSTEMDVAMIIETFDEFHEVIYDLFRWCVTDDFIEGLRG